MLLMVSCLVIQANSYEDGRMRVKTKVIAEKMINLRLVNLEQQKAKITLSSLDKVNTYYKESVQEHNGFAQNLDLSQVPEGKYLLTVKTKNQLLQQVLRVNEDSVYLSSFR